MTEAELFRITRTRSKRYVGYCAFDDCGFTTKVISHRVNCAMQMRSHALDVHGERSDYLNKYLEPSKRKGQANMKNPGKELPPMERLNEYEDHLCVFADAKVGTVKSQYGTSECDCQVWVYNKGAWKGLGETPIFWQTAGRQILDEIGPDSDTPDESMGGYLRKGGNPGRAGDFFWIEAAADKPDLALLKDWSKEYGEAF